MAVGKGITIPFTIDLSNIPAEVKRVEKELKKLIDTSKDLQITFNSRPLKEFSEVLVKRAVPNIKRDVERAKNLAAEIKVAAKALEQVRIGGVSGGIYKQLGMFADPKLGTLKVLERLREASQRVAEIQGGPGAVAARKKLISLRRQSISLLKQELSALTQRHRKYVKTGQVIGEQIQQQKSLGSMFSGRGGFLPLARVRWFAQLRLLWEVYRLIAAAVDTLIEKDEAMARSLRTARSEFMETGEVAEKYTFALRSIVGELGVTWREGGEALYQLGSAGLSAEQNLAALNSTMKLVVATEGDVREVTKAVAGIYNNFNKTLINQVTLTEKFAHINNVLATTWRDSQVEIDELIQGLRMSSQMAAQSGIRFEELSAMLGVLNTHMIKSGRAGRSLQNILARISQDPIRFARAFGIALDPTKPLKFLELMRQLHERLKGGQLTVIEIGEAFARLGLRGAPSFSTLVQNWEEVERAMTKTLNAGTNALDEMTELMTGRFTRVLEIFKSQFRVAIESSFGWARDAVRDFFAYVAIKFKTRNVVEWFRASIASIKTADIERLREAIRTVEAAPIGAFGQLTEQQRSKVLSDMKTALDRLYRMRDADKKRALLIAAQNKLIAEGAKQGAMSAKEQQRIYDMLALSHDTTFENSQRQLAAVRRRLKVERETFNIMLKFLEKREGSYTIIENQQKAVLRLEKQEAEILKVQQQEVDKLKERYTSIKKVAYKEALREWEDRAKGLANAHKAANNEFKHQLSLQEELVKQIENEGATREDQLVNRQKIIDYEIGQARARIIQAQEALTLEERRLGYIEKTTQLGAELNEEEARNARLRVETAKEKLEEEKRSLEITELRKQEVTNLIGVERSWSGQVVAGLREVHIEAINTFTNWKSLTIGVADALQSGLVDAMTNFVTGTESAAKSFSDFAKNFLMNVNRMVNQMLIAYGVQATLGWFLGRGTTPGTTGLAGSTFSSSQGLGAWVLKGRGGLLPHIEGFRQMSRGGLTGGPTSALLGDNTSGVELVIPKENIRKDRVDGYVRGTDEGSTYILNVVTQDDIHRVMAETGGRNVIINTLGRDLVERRSTQKLIKRQSRRS